MRNQRLSPSRVNLARRLAPLAVAAALLAGACEQAPPEPADGATPARIRLLTGQQYANVITEVFGADVNASVVPPMPPMARRDGLLASGAAAAGLTADQLSQIQQAAATVAAKVVDEEHRRFLVPCEPAETKAADPVCARRFLRAAGRLLQRRPLDEQRLAALVALAGRAAERLDDFHAGLAVALEAVLVSPEFLFIVDRSEADPSPEGAERLDAWSIASRLSFFLWNGPPDDALLQAAAAGELYTAAGRERQVQRMLASARLESGMRAFFDDMLAFDEFASLAKDAKVYPNVTGATLRDAREQTLRTLVDHLLVRGADYRDLFTTRETFMSMPLAAIYASPAGQGWTRHVFPADGPRIGLLTHMSFLAAHSHPVRSSPTLRGRALRELFLCQHVPDPPPNVDFSALEDAGDVATARERLQVHNENPSCAGCHLLMDPVGLALEHFDGAGRYRATDGGAALDVSGELDGVFYDDVAGLAEAVRNHPKLPWCLVNRLYAWGTGGPVSLRYDRATLDWLTERFGEAGYRLRTLLRDIATSRAFVAVRPARQPDETVARAFLDPMARAGAAERNEDTGEKLR